MVKLWFKKILVPSSNEKREVETVRLWEVSWQARTGSYSHSIKPEAEWFPSFEEAQAFKQSLADAHALLRNSEDIKITLERKW